MAYGSVLTDVVQSSTAGTPPQFNDGNGTQTGTLCRAWVNFNGTGTVAIRSSFNVSSITDNGTGDYTVNFTTAMPDANYAVNLMGNVDASTAYGYSFAAPFSAAPTTSAVRIAVSNPGTRVDAAYVFAAVFR